jgi:hypothetical protein
MRYIRIINEEINYPFSLQTLKIEYPNTSFPEKLENANLEEYGVYSVNDVTKPSHQNYTKIVNETTPILTNGQYYQNWVVEDAPIEYTESMLQNDIDSKWNQIRVTRNTYLSDCDWTQLPDSPLTTEKKGEWTAYRQALRDITLQEDPFNIIWPTKPL